VTIAAPRQAVGHDGNECQFLDAEAGLDRFPSIPEELGQPSNIERRLG